MKIRHIRALLLLMMAACVLSIQAQIRGSEIQVNVVPDHQDWTYEVGQTATFQISVTRSATLVDGVTIDYEAGPEMYQDVKKKGVVLKDGTLTLKGKMTKPGFYRVDVKAYVDGKEYKGACGAAFSPEKLQPTTVMPQDFESFWSNAIAEARKVDLNPTKRLLPERCTKDVNVYEVSFNNMQWDYRTYGILSVPVKEGKYPALLRVPGAGVRPYGGDIYTASQGDDIFHGALNWYWEFYTDDRDKNYYKRVVLGCIRALDYIAEYTPWNGKEMGVSGSSQGGFLTLATAALDKRITYYAPVHAALCDHTASLQGVACGWPHYFYWNKGKGQEKQIEVSRYYDGVNFARLITNQQKGWFSFGYNDDVVPPTTAWATYNIVKGPKEIKPYQATWHFWFQEQWDEWENWMLKQMNLRK